MSDGGFSEQERAAMRQRAEELRSATGVKGAAKRAREYDACLAAIDALGGADRAVAERLHVIVSEEAPQLAPKTWYGFPSYAREDKVVVFFQPASKFGTRYGTVGFSEDAALDDGEMWPTSFAVLEVTAAADQRLRDLVRRAAG
ncbi:hypothetical protein [Amnibacterium endophyticum]|uniref:YdhG-like domain-containing protein n=1 Tax=Amnibacterium endophyticum TaxID=2109337 RepID=A0ABW4LE87_9MICO